MRPPLDKVLREAYAGSSDSAYIIWPHARHRDEPRPWCNRFAPKSGENKGNIMNMSIVRKLWSGLAVMAILAIAFIFIAEPLMESRKAAEIEDYIKSLPGTFTAGHVTTNLLEGTFIISNLTGTLKNADGSESAVSILEIEGAGPGDGSAGAPLLKEGQITHLTVATTATVDGTSVPREITVERLFFHDLEGAASDAGSLADRVAGLSVSDLNAFACSDSVNTGGGTFTVEAQSLDFTAGSEGRGSLAALERLLLPDILREGAGAGADRDVIGGAWADFTASGGMTRVSLRPDGPLSLERLGRDGDFSLNAAAKHTAAKHTAVQ